MNVLVDNCVWSLALRRKKNAQVAVVKVLGEQQGIRRSGKPIKDTTISIPGRRI